jgi:hypothetical protein
MKGIFDIPEKKEDLSSSNSGVSNMYYDQIQALRSITDSDTDQNRFGDGSIDLRWRMSAGSYWIPNRSFLKIRVSLTKADGTQLEEGDNIAPAMGCASCLFNKMSFKINNRTVSEISEQIPQIDALYKRLYNSGYWLDNYGQSTNFYSADFRNRQLQMINKPFLSRSHKEFFYPSEIEDFTEILVNPELAADTILWTKATTTFTFTDANGNNLKLNPNIIIGSLLVVKLLAADVYQNVIVTDITVDPLTGVLTTIVIDKDLGANVVAAVLNLTTIRIRAMVNPEIVNTVVMSENSRNLKEFELIWQPPLSIFKITHAVPGSSQQELELSPYSNPLYKKQFIQSLISKIPDIGKDYKLQIKELYLYLCRVDGPRIDQKTYILDLNEIKCQKLSLDSFQTTQTALTVEPSTTALTIAFQDNRIGENTIYSPTLFRMGNESQQDELNIIRFYIRYAGQQKQQPDADTDGGKATPNRDWLVDQYARNNLYTGKYIGCGGESIEDWKKRGIYFHYPWPKTATDTSTQAYVLTQFSQAFSNDPQKLLVFNHFKKAAIIQVENAEVISITVVNN